MEIGVHSALVGQLLHSTRTSKGVSLRDISENSGVDIKNLHQYENGVVSPTIEKLMRLLPYYGLRPDAFWRKLYSPNNIKAYLRKYIYSNHLNWSYEDLSDNELIGKIILYGSSSHISLLLRSYERQTIIDCWMSQYSAQPQFESQNIYITMMLFPKSDPYIKFNQLQNEYRTSQQGDARSYEALISETRS